MNGIIRQMYLKSLKALMLAEARVVDMLRLGIPWWIEMYFRECWHYDGWYCFWNLIDFFCLFLFPRLTSLSGYRSFDWTCWNIWLRINFRLIIIVIKQSLSLKMIILIKICKNNFTNSILQFMILIFKATRKIN